MSRKKSDQIAAELQATRTRLIASIDRLEDQLSPSRMADRATSVVTESLGKVKSVVGLETVLKLVGLRR